MRLLAGIFALAVLSGTAGADVEPLPKWTLGLSFMGHGGAINGVSEGGLGPAAEFALSSSRTQYFLETGIAWVTYGPAMEPAKGFQARGAIGARWIARSFEPGDGGAVEMTLEALAGAHKFWFEDATLVRPEIAVGWGIQVRKYEAPLAAAIRFGVRVFWSPIDSDEEAATPLARCTGSCGSSASPLTNGGIMVLIGGAL